MNFASLSLIISKYGLYSEIKYTDDDFYLKLKKKQMGEYGLYSEIKSFIVIHCRKKKQENKTVTVELYYRPCRHKYCGICSLLLVVILLFESNIYRIILRFLISFFGC